jgi:hypothetical protein
MKKLIHRREFIAASTVVAAGLRMGVGSSAAQTPSGFARVNWHTHPSSARLVEGVRRGRIQRAVPRLVSRAA